jgi:hypothetical protein
LCDYGSNLLKKSQFQNSNVKWMSKFKLRLRFRLRFRRLAHQYRQKIVDIY